MSELKTWVEIVETRDGLSLANGWKKLLLRIKIVPLEKVRDYELFVKKTERSLKVLVPDKVDPFFAELLDYLEQHSRKRIIPVFRMK